MSITDAAHHFNGFDLGLFHELVSVSFRNFLGIRNLDNLLRDENEFMLAADKMIVFLPNCLWCVLDFGGHNVRDNRYEDARRKIPHQAVRPF